MDAGPLLDAVNTYESRCAIARNEGYAAALWRDIAFIAVTGG